MGAMVSQITSLTIVYLAVYSGEDQRKHQKPRVTGLCVDNSPVTAEFPAQMVSNAEMYLLDDVIIIWINAYFLVFTLNICIVLKWCLLFVL